ncbi:collagen alpha-1(I) chain-like isoform X2 [Phacochoerus africanus]|uniref:collagen alpha-1(I) chain-like isoform X2 n=1 Tax=Phacochoerus africanus TaxID=41426 RepID=UPI001FDA98F6|nr:collagen alpha-1(I) chain-like isoform X2 [Phacochoerus africanus]
MCSGTPPIDVQALKKKVSRVTCDPGVQAILSHLLLYVTDHEVGPQGPPPAAGSRASHAPEPQDTQRRPTRFQLLQAKFMGSGREPRLKRTREVGRLIFKDKQGPGKGLVTATIHKLLEKAGAGADGPAQGREREKARPPAGRSSVKNILKAFLAAEEKEAQEKPLSELPEAAKGLLPKVGGRRSLALTKLREKFEQSGGLCAEAAVLPLRLDQRKKKHLPQKQLHRPELRVLRTATWASTCVRAPPARFLACSAEPVLPCSVATVVCGPRSWLSRGARVTHRDVGQEPRGEAGTSLHTGAMAPSGSQVPGWGQPPQSPAPRTTAPRDSLETVFPSSGPEFILRAAPSPASPRDEALRGCEPVTAPLGPASPGCAGAAGGKRTGDAPGARGAGLGPWPGLVEEGAGAAPDVILRACCSEDETDGATADTEPEPLFAVQENLPEEKAPGQIPPLAVPAAQAARRTQPAMEPPQVTVRLPVVHTMPPPPATPQRANGPHDHRDQGWCLGGEGVCGITGVPPPTTAGPTQQGLWPEPTPVPPRGAAHGGPGIPKVVVPKAGVSEAGVLKAGVPKAGILKAGVPKASVSEAGVSEAGVPKASVCEESVPKAGILKADVPKAGVLKASVSEVSVPKAGVSVAGVRKAGAPEAGVLKAGVPKAGISEAGVPKASVSEAGVLKAGIPKASVSEAGVLEAGVPKVGVSEAGVSKAGVPEAGVTKAGVSEAGVPKAGVPKAGVPKADISEAGVPKASVSEAGVPKAGVPKTNLSKAGVSEAGVPKTAVPEAVPPRKPQRCGPGGKETKGSPGVSLKLQKHEDIWGQDASQLSSEAWPPERLDRWARDARTPPHHSEASESQQRGLASCAPGGQQAPVPEAPSREHQTGIPTRPASPAKGRMKPEGLASADKSPLHEQGRHRGPLLSPESTRPLLAAEGSASHDLGENRVTSLNERPKPSVRAPGQAAAAEAPQGPPAPATGNTLRPQDRAAEERASRQEVGRGVQPPGPALVAKEPAGPPRGHGTCRASGSLPSPRQEALGTPGLPVEPPVPASGERAAGKMKGPTGGGTAGAMKWSPPGGSPEPPTPARDGPAPQGGHAWGARPRPLENQRAEGGARPLSAEQPPLGAGPSRQPPPMCTAAGGQRVDGAAQEHPDLRAPGEVTAGHRQLPGADLGSRGSPRGREQGGRGPVSLDSPGRKGEAAWRQKAGWGGAEGAASRALDEAAATVEAASLHTGKGPERPAGRRGRGTEGPPRGQGHWGQAAASQAPPLSGSPAGWAQAPPSRVVPLDLARPTGGSAEVARTIGKSGVSQRPDPRGGQCGPGKPRGEGESLTAPSPQPGQGPTAPLTPAQERPPDPARAGTGTRGRGPGARAAHLAKYRAQSFSDQRSFELSFRPMVIRANDTFALPK